MPEAKYRIEVFSKITDYRGNVLKNKLTKSGFNIENITISENYLINLEIDHSDAEKVAKALSQSVTQEYLVNKHHVPEKFAYAIEIGYHPGVTDNVSHTVKEIVEDMLKINIGHESKVFSSITYFIGGTINRSDAEKISLELHNPLIQRAKILEKAEYEKNGMGRYIPVVDLHERASVDTVDLNLSDNDLSDLGKNGIKNPDGTRRGPLALDLPSMKVIKEYFDKEEKRSPRDIELESIAQTWSEHCKHTIFAAKIDGSADGIFKKYIRAATEKIRRDRGADDFCVSVFTDNAGGIIFDDEYMVADKAETHNSPSALDPFGGSITGIVGVNRDLMGFGLGAKPIANRYGFCFAYPEDKRPLYRGKDEDSKLLPPKRIMDGVIHGVNVGGNCSGIPTPQGFVFYDDSYKAKPLVFVGTVGLIPRKINGKLSHVKKAKPGDLIIVAGGRVGLDGIHGATFSSEALSSGSPATAVQIGDPITQKKMSDAIMREARDMMLYNSITDNGAGGLSCSVAEMAKESGGFEVELENIPLKYPGLSPWQIWVSESQERMTFAVSPENADKLIALFKKRGVEATVIGKFTSSGKGTVRYKGEVIFDLDMKFLHDGLPQKEFSTKLNLPAYTKETIKEESDYSGALLEMLASHNISSYEFITTQYDHEVQANSVIKPIQGKGRVNSNASVVRPVPTSKKGVALSQGLYPSYSEYDPYKMAACSIDTAVRNLIAVGCPADKIALMDNFCWCDSTNSERLGQLKAASEACYDYAVSYGTPYISGKDSMFNDFKGYDDSFRETAISIKPTLLISSIGIVSDISKCQTMDFKMPGDAIYLIGKTSDELRGSEYFSVMGKKSGNIISGGKVPAVNAEKNLELYKLLNLAMQKNLIASSVSVERGGLIVAAAKSAMAGVLGADIDLSGILPGCEGKTYSALFSESQGRFLVSAAGKNCSELEKLFAGKDFARIGTVNGSGNFSITETGGKKIISLEIGTMLKNYRKTN